MPCSGMLSLCPCAAAQVAFFKGFIDTAKAPPAWLRMVAKRGTFFAPLDPTRTPSASLPKLLKRCATPSHLNARRNEMVCTTVTSAKCRASLETDSVIHCVMTSSGVPSRDLLL